MNPSQVVSLLIVISLIIGMALHKKRALHKWWMIATVLTDIALVAYLTFARNAVIKAMDSTMGNKEFSAILVIHISFAVMSIVCYVIGIMLGFKISAGRVRLLSAHRINARVMLLFRCLTFITAFFIPISN